VTAFLVNYFRRYLEYDYTATLEGELDDVSAGDKHYKDVLERFWKDFSAAVAETSELRITDVLEKINEVLEPHLFPPNAGRHDPRLCPNCGNGRLSMRTARSGGAFIGCSNYPECRYTRPFGPPGVEGDGAADGLGPDGKMLGVDPDSLAGGASQDRALRALRPARRGDGGGQETAARLPAQGLGGRRRWTSRRR
jgi:DNA topoisomerase-1